MLGHFPPIKSKREQTEVKGSGIEMSQFNLTKGGRMDGLSLVLESYGRCCLSGNFFDRFYEIFLASNTAFPKMFANTEFVKQKALLKTGIAMLLSHLDGKPVGTAGVNRIAETHNKKNMNINPNLYQYWIDSLIAAVKECDSKFDADLERLWQKTLRAGVDCIASKYNIP